MSTIIFDIRRARRILLSSIIFPFILLLLGFLLINFVTLSDVFVITIIISVSFLFITLRKLFTPYNRRTPKESIIQIHISYEYTKKALYVMLPTLIILTISFYQLLPIYVESNPQEFLTSKLTSKTTTILVPLIFTTLSIAFIGATVPFVFYYISFKLTLLKSQFNYLSAAIWMQLMAEEKDPIEKIKYFETGLNYYNVYLKRKLKLKINEVQLYSQLLSRSTEDRNNSLNSISKAFVGNDTLKPIAESSSFIQAPILAREKLQSKIKEVVIFLVAVVPVIITVAQLMFPYFKFE